MMKYIISFIYIISFFSSLANGLYPYKENGKWGYIDHNGKKLIPAQYDDAKPFHQGLAVIMKDSMYGIITGEGQLVINLSGRKLYGFHHGLCRVEVKGKYGFIDKNDSVVVPIDLDFAEDFGHTWTIAGHTEGRSYRYFIITNQNTRIGLKHKNPFREQEISENTVMDGFITGELIGIPEKENKKGRFTVTFFDSTGKKLLSVPSFYGVSEGLIAFCNKPPFFDCGYMDFKGQIQIKTLYSYPHHFMEGLAAVRSGHHLYYFIGRDGITAIKDSFEDVYGGFSDGLCLVKKAGRWIYIDQRGKTVISTQGLAPASIFTSMDYFGEYSLYKKGELIRVLINDRLSYINEEGLIVWTE